MSGGHFNYDQYKIQQIADEVEQLILTNGVPSEPNGRGESYTCEYSPEVIAEFKRGLLVLRAAAIYAQRIDWLVSCDDGEDSFLRRLAAELQQLPAELKFGDVK